MAGPYVYEAIADVNSGQGERAATELSKAERLSARGDADKDMQARAFFELGALFQKEFDKLAFSGPDSVDAVLGRKLELAQGIEQQYVGAINLGRAQWAIASLAEAPGCTAICRRSSRRRPSPRCSRGPIASSSSSSSRSAARSMIRKPRKH